MIQIYQPINIFNLITTIICLYIYEKFNNVKMHPKCIQKNIKYPKNSICYDI